VPDAADSDAAEWTTLGGDLKRFERLPAAVRVERVAEREILMLLQLQGFDRSTPEWGVVAKALVEYGYSVFCAWLATGVARRMAARHAGGRGVIGLSKIPEGLRLDDDDAHALSLELMLVALERFRTQTLMNPHRTWRPEGGASLKTYFIGRCLMELPDTYQRWAHSEKDRLVLMADLPDDGLISVDPSVQVLAGAALDEMDPEVRVMFELQNRGYTLLEIAEMLTASGFSHTEGSVRTRMSRARVAARAS